MSYDVIKIDNSWIVQLEELAQNALDDGYKIVRRTIDQWIEGTNRFENPKEVLYGVRIDDQIVAIGGMNIDPYLMDEDIGRVRHIYVHTDYRNQGIAKFLFHKIMKDKAHYFNLIRLTARNEIAMNLYESYGFKRVTEFKATHILPVKRIFQKVDK